MHAQVIHVNLQGFVEYRTFGTAGQQEGIVALIARRSRLHPGTRYLARGLNSCYSTGRLTYLKMIYYVCFFSILAYDVQIRSIIFLKHVYSFSLLCFFISICIGQEMKLSANNLYGFQKDLVKMSLSTHTYGDEALYLSGGAQN